MRSKVVLIQGNINLSKNITLSEYERINADRVCVIAALKRPQFIPYEQSWNDLNYLEQNTERLLSYWRTEEFDHLVASEYAEIALEREKQIKVVEGNILKINWFYEMVRTFHKGFGSIIIECKILEQNLISIGENVHSIESAISLLGPHPELG